MASESLAQDCRASVGHSFGTNAEVLCAPEHLAAAAVTALGWHGTMLPPATLLGRRVVVVADLLKEVHERRVASGWGPVTDRMSVSMWNWPEMAHLVPPPAVRLRGILVPARHWRTGLAGTTPFAGLCATALLLPAHIARDLACRAYARRYGPSVVAAGGSDDADDLDVVDVVQPGQLGPVLGSRSTPITRWVHEFVYDRLLRTTEPRSGHTAQ